MQSGGDLIMERLAGRHVFLSASFPSGERGEGFQPFDAGEIAEAVTAIVRAVLASGGKLVFGGHPTITPLVLMIGSEIGVRHAVNVFQSEWFKDRITAETIRLYGSEIGSIHWTRRCPTRDHSLLEMRRLMFDFVELDGAVFVGGMEGIFDEYEYAGRVLPGVPRIPIAGPGGAAARLPSDAPDCPASLRQWIGSRRYPFVASLIVDALAESDT